MGAVAVDPAGQNDPLISADYRIAADFMIAAPFAIDRAAVYWSRQRVECSVAFLTFRWPLTNAFPCRRCDPRGFRRILSVHGGNLAVESVTDVFGFDRPGEFFESELLARLANSVERFVDCAIRVGAEGCCFRPAEAVRAGIEADRKK